MGLKLRSPVMTNYFSGIDFSQVSYLHIDSINSGSWQYGHTMFKNGKSPRHIHVSTTGWVSSGLQMFKGTSTTRYITLDGNWACRDMSGMFEGSGIYQSPSGLSYTNLSNSGYTFDGCTSLQTIVNPSDNSILKLSDYTPQTFCNCISLTTINAVIDLQLLNGNAQSVYHLFFNTPNLTSLKLKNICKNNNWLTINFTDTSIWGGVQNMNATSVDYMIRNAYDRSAENDWATLIIGNAYTYMTSELLGIANNKHISVVSSPDS